MPSIELSEKQVLHLRSALSTYIYDAQQFLAHSDPERDDHMEMLWEVPILSGILELLEAAYAND